MPDGEPGMPQKPTESGESPEPTTPPGRWRPNELLRQAALRVVQRNAGMSTGHARGEAAGSSSSGRFNSFAQRDSGREFECHADLSSFGRSLGRRIGLTGRFLNSLPSIFHASTLDLPSLVEESLMQVTIEIVDPSSDDEQSPSQPSTSRSFEDRPFGPYSSESDGSDSDAAYEQPIKLSQKSEPNARQNSRHAGLGFSELDQSDSSSARHRRTGTISAPSELGTLFEVDQRESAGGSDSDTSSKFHADSSDELGVNVRESNRRSPFLFQSVYSRPPNSEEEDEIEILDVEVADAISRNVDDAGGHEPEANEGSEILLEESGSKVQNDAEDEFYILEDESQYHVVEEYLRSIEETDENEEEDEVNGDEVRIPLDEDEVQWEVDGDGAEEENDEEEYEPSVAEDEYDETSLSESEDCHSLQGKDQLFVNEELSHDGEINDKDDTTIEYGYTDESNQDPCFIENELSTEENQDIDEEDDRFAADEELPTLDEEVVNE